ncbi:hypothetical protein BC835DRAFT_805388 [Cytidiella melzeri]|nr:hypothetical protein BC835DRAFT_805388 [Cytidiella melzeri]
MCSLVVLSSSFARHALSSTHRLSFPCIDRRWSRRLHGVVQRGGRLVGSEGRSESKAMVCQCGLYTLFPRVCAGGRVDGNGERGFGAEVWPASGSGFTLALPSAVRRTGYFDPIDKVT